MNYLLHIWPDAPLCTGLITSRFDDEADAMRALGDKIPQIRAWNLVRETKLGGRMGGPSIWHGSPGGSHDRSRYGEIWSQAFKALVGFPNSKGPA